MSETILTQDHGLWTEVTLNRSSKLNSFNDEVPVALRQTLKAIGAHAILLTGAGRGFCAGQDLGDRDPAKMDGSPDLSQTPTTFYNPLLPLIKEAPLPAFKAKRAA